MAYYVPALLILLVLSLILRVDPLFTAVWFLAGLYMLARLWTQRTAQQLRVVRTFAERAFTGDDVQVRLTIRNTSRLPVPWLEISESLPLELTGTPFPPQALNLRGREERQFMYTLQCRRRGYYAVGPLRAETGDLLGIEQRLLVAQEPRHILVYPRVVPIERLGLPTRSALVTLPSPLPLFEDTSRVMGVRDYRPGDSQRRIHWTATARTGQLLVKQYQPAIARETLICLDLDWKHYPVRRHDASEEAIVVAASLANHTIAHERLPAGLATEARDPLVDERRRISLPPRAEAAQLMAILEVLARVQIATGGRFVDLLRDQSVHLAWGSTLVVITGQVDEELLGMLMYLKHGGRAVSLFLIQDSRGGSTDEYRDMVDIPIHRVWTDSDLAVVQ